MAFRPEAMAVVPEAVHAGDLHVAEAVGRVVLADERAPARAHAEHLHAIVQHEILRHDGGLRGEDPEAKPRRRDAGQVARILEEREGLGEPTRHPLPPTQRIDRLPDHAPEYIESAER